MPLLATLANSPATVVAAPLKLIAVEPRTSLAPPVVCTAGVSSTPTVAALTVTTGAVGPSSRKLMWVPISAAVELTWSPSPSVSVTVTATDPAASDSRSFGVLVALSWCSDRYCAT